MGVLYCSKNNGVIVTMKCKIDYCMSTKILGNGMCGKHYYRFRKYGKDYTANPWHTEDTHHPLYETWRGMKKRCYDIHNASFPSYGAKGIIVCERWLGPNGFKNFIKDMGDKPSPSHTLDRIDPKGNYAPENCRWLTRIEQNLNQNTTSSTPYIYGKRNYWEVYIRRNGINIKKRCKTLEEAIAFRNTKLIEMDGKLPVGL